jgi:hypothetical protein
MVVFNSNPHAALLRLRLMPPAVASTGRCGRKRGHRTRSRSDSRRDRAARGEIAAIVHCLRSLAIDLSSTALRSPRRSRSPAHRLRWGLFTVAMRRRGLVLGAAATSLVEMRAGVR